MRGIYFNSKQAVCSIWESGKMVYDILCQSCKYILDYTEADSIPTNIQDYDFIIVNFHLTVNNWITAGILQLINKLSYCVVTEVGLDDNNLFYITPTIFNQYIFLDPTITETNTIHGFPRPLDQISSFMNYVNREASTVDTGLQLHASGIDVTLNSKHTSMLLRKSINRTPSGGDCLQSPCTSNWDLSVPVVGSFGFATTGKCWHEIVRAVCNEFDQAIIRFNIPKATYVTDIMFYKEIIAIKQLCKPMLDNKPGIKLIISHNVMNKSDLVNWCSNNTINCFFYDRYNQGFRAGLCAVTDQAILSRRPLLTTGDPTFRHITNFIKPYPEQSIREAIANTADSVAKLCDAWAPSIFLAKFESCLLG